MLAQRKVHIKVKTEKELEKMPKDLLNFKLLANSFMNLNLAIKALNFHILANKSFCLNFSLL